MMYRYVALIDHDIVAFEADHIVADGYHLFFYLEGRLVKTLLGDEVDSLEMV